MATSASPPVNPTSAKTWSPGENRVTRSPTDSTTPATSQPAIIGWRGFRSPNRRRTRNGSARMTCQSAALSPGGHDAHRHLVGGRGRDLDLLEAEHVRRTVSLVGPRLHRRANRTLALDQGAGRERRRTLDDPHDIHPSLRGRRVSNPRPPSSCQGPGAIPGPNGLATPGTLSPVIACGQGLPGELRAEDPDQVLGGGDAASDRSLDPAGALGGDVGARRRRAGLRAPRARRTCRR